MTAGTHDRALVGRQALVSIITVVYNGAGTLQRTIDSVAQQSYGSIEYIVIDGGSTDSTVDVIQANLSIVREWSSEPDHGIYDAMNKGISRARGEIIGIINSDDWYEPSAVEDAVSALTKSGADICVGELKLWRDRTCVGTIRPVLASDPGASRLHTVHPTFFVRRHVYEQVGRFDSRYRISADKDFIIRCIRAGIHVVNARKVLANFTVGGTSSKNSGIESLLIAVRNRLPARYIARDLFGVVKNTGKLVAMALARPFAGSRFS